ncbi:MAG: molybdopterin cofactor-binding domain-containing protein [Ilumatobacteraceae bacterium]
MLERAAGHASGPYRFQALDVRAVAARTNNPVCGAFRGFGANQAQFAMEAASIGSPPRSASPVGTSGSAA